jgi:flagella basal body P-ring formation protein FlgA
MSNSVFVAQLLKSMRLSLQTLCALLLLIPFGSFAMSLAKESFAANLRNIAVIEESVIRAGDVFEGLQYKADTILGPAPQPGKDIVLNARTLLRIAVALDLLSRVRAFKTISLPG